MGLIDVADDIARDFAEKGVSAKVYFGPEFLAQNDAGNRIVVVPSRDKYDRLQHMGGSNPRPLMTRHAGAMVQIWAVSGESDPKLKPAADWRALDSLINQFISSLHLTHPGNYELGEGQVNTKTKHSAWGKQYDLQIWILHPITEKESRTIGDASRGGHTYLVFNGTQEQAD